MLKVTEDCRSTKIPSSLFSWTKLLSTITASPNCTDIPLPGGRKETDVTFGQVKAQFYILSHFPKLLDRFSSHLADYVFFRQPKLLYYIFTSSCGISIFSHFVSKYLYLFLNVIPASHYQWSNIIFPLYLHCWRLCCTQWLPWWQFYKVECLYLPWRHSRSLCCFDWECPLTPPPVSRSDDLCPTNVDQKTS